MRNTRLDILDQKWLCGRASDERGLGQSPGLLDTMSKETGERFFNALEFAVEQPLPSGKVGLLGISYYAGSQWRVAARQPKGLAAIIPGKECLITTATTVAMGYPLGRIY